ncbi:cytidylate kinase family protein [Flavobacterium sp. SUN046]|uniref:cytidylate kinase family protein n=1 Tax=Flavobacterium sp. SUN046 TaxID=3002440 RepID=UPI002DB905C9|nr:cytidylate kinase family protein [Flavobacterium sp. SUN046]MEC4049109.1 cytidylate kinase family protein [Flavobacterium sp. SUN046]
MKTSINKITLSGEVASGKSTIGKLLAKQLNFEFISIGNKTREYANTKGLTIVEFQKECLLNSDIDKQIDKEFSNDCNTNFNLVIDYRLGFNFINNGFHVFLKINEEEATKRLKAANRINESHLTINERNNSFKNQFLNAYGVDYTQEKHYDLIIDVSNYSNVENIGAIIQQQFESKKVKV